jgi:hypothetical protein
VQKCADAVTFMGRMVSEPAGSNHTAMKRRKDELGFRVAISALDDDRRSCLGGDWICRIRVLSKQEWSARRQAAGKKSGVAGNALPPKSSPGNTSSGPSTKQFQRGQEEAKGPRPSIETGPKQSRTRYPWRLPASQQNRAQSRRRMRATRP